MNKIKLKSNFDGLELSVLISEPKSKAKGIVQISHGMAEHKERYVPFMNFLNDNGYITIIHDHRGHGESVKDLNDLGYFKDTKGLAIVEDLRQVTLYVKEKHPNLPVYLFGHSMGSMVERVFLKKYDTIIDKLIVSGSPSKLYGTSLAILLANIMIKFKGERYHSKFINEFVFGDYNNNIKGAKSDNSWLCSDVDIVDNYDKDELCGFVFTLNGFLNLFSLMKETYTKKGYLVNHQDLPIYFIGGECDPVIGSREELMDAIAFLKNLGYQNINSKLYPNLRHELLNEVNKEAIYEDILDFLNA